MNPVQPSQSASVRPLYYQELDRLVGKYQGKEISKLNPQTLAADYQKLVTAVQKLARTELTTIEDKTTATDCWRVGNQIRETFNSKNIVEYKVPVLGFLSAFFSQAWSKGLKCAAKETTYVKVDSINAFQNNEGVYKKIFNDVLQKSNVDPNNYDITQHSISKIREDAAHRKQSVENAKKLEQINRAKNELENKLETFKVPDPKGAQALLQKYGFASSGDELVFLSSDLSVTGRYPAVHMLDGERDTKKWLSDMQKQGEQDPEAYLTLLQNIQKGHEAYQKASVIDSLRKEFDESAFLNGVTSFGTPSSLPCFCYQKTEDNARLKLILMQDQKPPHNIEVDLKTKPGQIILKTQPEQVFHTFAGFKQFVNEKYNIDLDTKNSLPVRDQAQTQAINDCVKKCASEAISLQEFEKNIELCKSLETKNKTLSQIVQDGAGLFLYTVSFDDRGTSTQKKEELHPEYKNSSASMYRNKEKFEGIQGDSLQKFAVKSNKEREEIINKKLDELRESTSANNVDKSEIETFVGKVNTTLGSQKLLPDQFFSFHISKKPYNLFVTKVWGDTTPNVTVSTWNDIKKTYELKTYPITCPNKKVFVLDGTEFSSIQAIKKYCSDNFGMTKVDFEKKFTKVQANLEAIQKDRHHSTQKEPQVRKALESFSSVPAVHKEKTWVFHSSSVKEAPHLYAYKNGLEVKLPVICTENGYQVGVATYPTFKQLVSGLNETYGPCLPILQELDRTIQKFQKEIESAHIPYSGQKRTTSQLYCEGFNVDVAAHMQMVQNFTNKENDVMVIGKNQLQDQSKTAIPQYTLLHGYVDRSKTKKIDTYTVDLIIDPKTLACTMRLTNNQKKASYTINNLQESLDRILPVNEDNATTYNEIAMQARRPEQEENIVYVERKDIQAAINLFTPQKKENCINLSSPSIDTVISQMGSSKQIQEIDYLEQSLYALEQTITDYSERNKENTWFSFTKNTPLEPKLQNLFDREKFFKLNEFEMDMDDIRVKAIASRIRGLSDLAVQKNDKKIAEWICLFVSKCSFPTDIFSKKFVEQFPSLYKNIIPSDEGLDSEE